MAKSKRTKILKIIGGLIVFITLPTLLLFGFLYIKYDEPLPNGEQGPKADQLAIKMLSALDEAAYSNTDYIEWTFKGVHHYKWYKTNNICEVYWDQINVILDLTDRDKSKVFVAEQPYNGEEMHDYIHKAEGYFNNDSFWLVAPYKVFDPGTERRLVTTEEGKKALLVTYTSGGSTPGDSYLWHMDSTGKPTKFQMWVNILPIGGLEASWNQWITTDSGAQLPSTHEFMFLELDMGDIKGLNL